MRAKATHKRRFAITILVPKSSMGETRRQIASSAYRRVTTSADAARSRFPCASGRTWRPQPTPWRPLVTTWMEAPDPGV